VLDEPTERLDDETAAGLTADLLAATADRGLVLITHRRFGLSEVDEVVDLTKAGDGDRPEIARARTFLASPEVAKTSKPPG